MLTSFTAGTSISERVSHTYKNYIKEIDAYHLHHGVFPDSIGQINGATQIGQTQYSGGQKSEARVLNTPLYYIKFKEHGDAILYYQTFGFGEQREHFFSPEAPPNAQ